MTVELAWSVSDSVVPVTVTDSIVAEDATTMILALPTVNEPLVVTVTSLYAAEAKAGNASAVRMSALRIFFMGIR
jgi:hypothetical protein